MSTQVDSFLGFAGMEGPSSPQQEALLLVTTVDIGEGRSDKIEVRRGDNSMDVARAFVTKHNLPPAIMPRLALHLEENLTKAAAQQQGGALQHSTRDGGAQQQEDMAVFHRLYEQAIALRQKLGQRRDEVKRSELETIKTNKPTMSWISSEMMKERSSGSFGNYGQMLYAESMEALAKRKDKEQRRKAERHEQEVAGVTFKPEICRLAQNLWTPEECASVPAWQRLSKVKLTKAQERLEALRREKAEAAVKECTFKPQLSTGSEKLMKERSQTLNSLNVSAHQQLYQDAVRRQQKQQEYQHWYPEEVTFQPKLHESAMSRAWERKSLGPEAAALLAASGEERHMALVNRLYANYEKLQKKLQEARSSIQSSVDPTTGRKLFQPETGRAPIYTRNTSQLPVGEYLYSLKQQQEDKARAAAEELERKRQAEAASTKQAQGSKNLVKALQQKRFRQIFDFLDQQGLGSFNLVELMAAAPDWVNELDEEICEDLQAAAKLLSKRSLKHTDSNKSDASSIFMPPPPLDISEAAAESDSAPTTPSSGLPGVVTFKQFCMVMEDVLATRRRPRIYLAPSPPRKYVPTETYHPQINEQSKRLAAKIRPKETPVFNVLYQESSLLSQRLDEKRAQVEAAQSKVCTFAPKLVSQQLVKEGRAMRGAGYHRAESDSGSQLGDLPSADSLQHLAAMMAAAPQQEEQSAACFTAGQAANAAGATSSQQWDQAPADAAATEDFADTVAQDEAYAAYQQEEQQVVPNVLGSIVNATTVGKAVDVY
eukprot:GHRR01016925.1.p1 GENE.GHRR01016925.1~~GHRR01016925.1.p1  ORF type:complete len:770 (+),score=302.29 GHRR01016925.1:355-2664(+)